MLELLIKILAYFLKCDYFIISRHFWYPTWYPQKRFYTLGYFFLKAELTNQVKGCFYRYLTDSWRGEETLKKFQNPTLKENCLIP